MFRASRVQKAVKISAKIFMFLGVFSLVLAGSYHPDSPVAEVKTAQAAPDGTGMFIYDEDGANNVAPRYRTWSGTDLGAESSLQDDDDASDDTNHTIIEAAPTRNEYIMGRLIAPGDLDIQVWNGSSWIDGTNAPTNGDFTTGIGTTNDIYRGFDIAYENVSGRGMVLYESSSSGDGALKYRTWDGNSWSSEQTLDYSAIDEGNDITTWVECTADFGSNNILCGWQENVNDGIYAARWDGDNSTWVHTSLIEGAGQGGVYKNFDLAWEGTSGEGMIAYGLEASTWIDAKVYTTSGGFADAGTDPTGPGTATNSWINIAGSPNNNYIALTYTEDISSTSSDYGVDIWNGSDWTTITTPSEDIDINSFGFNQGRHVAWEQGAGDRALFAWRDGTTNETYIRYMVFDVGAGQFQAIEDGTHCANTEGGLGSTEQVTSLSAAEDSAGPCSAAGMVWTDVVQAIDLNPRPGSNEIMLIASDLTADLAPELQRWNGDANGTWLTQTSNMGAPEADLSTGATLSASLPTRAFDFAFRASEAANVNAIGTQTASMSVSTTNNYLDGAFTINNSGASANITSIKITENGTIDALNNLDNIKLYYESDTSSPYTCHSESLSSPSSPTEAPFGSTDTDGFTAANGTSTFSGTSVAVTTTSTMCVYVVFDVGAAGGSDTIEIEISNPSADVLISAGTIGPAFPQIMPGTTSFFAISGDCKAFNQSTNCTDSQTIKWAKNGTIQGTSGTSSGGTFSFSATAPSANDIITVFIDNVTDSNEAVAVTKYSSGSLSGLKLYAEHLTIGSNQNTSISNANLGQYDNDQDEDIIFNVNGSNRLVLDDDGGSSQEKLYIDASDTYAPAGDIETGGSWQNLGTFTHGSGTIFFTATTTGHTVTSNGASGNFYNLVFNGSGGGWTLQDNTTVANFISIDAGNFDASSRTLTLSGIGKTSDAWCNDTSGVTCTTSWKYRKKITLDNATSGTTLTDFPILVRLDKAKIDYGNTQGSGQDIRFVTSADANTALSHEIELWDETGYSYVWVKVPSLVNNNTQYIWMYYGNSAISDGQNVTGTWNSAYVLVMHLNETPDNSANQVQDSTSNNNDGDTVAMESGDRVDAKVGKGFDFDGAAERMSVTDTTSLQVQNNTLSAWVKHDATITAGERLFIIDKVWSGSSDAYGIAFMGTGTNTASTRHLQEPDAEPSFYDTTSPTNPVPDTWYHFTGKWDGSTMTTFLNATAQTPTEAHTAALTYGSQDLQIAAEDQGGCCQSWWDGIIDEVRISNTARSNDWIATEYRWGNAPDTYNTFGGTEAQAPFAVTGTFTYSTSKLVFNSTTAVVPPALSGGAGTNGYYDLELAPAGSVTYTLASGTYKINGDLIVGNNSNALTLQVNTNDPAVDIDDFLDIKINSIFQASNSAALNVGGNFAQGTGSSWVDNGGSITFDAGDTGNTITTGVMTCGNGFNNLTFNNSNGAWLNDGSQLCLDGNLTITAGAVTSNYNFYMLGDTGLSASGAGTLTLNDGTSFTLNSEFNLANTGNWVFDDITFDGGVSDWSGAGTVTINGILNITNAGDDFDAGSKTIILTNTGTPFNYTAGTFTANASLFRYTGNGATNIKNTTYYDLELKPSGNATHTLGTAGSQTITVNRHFVCGNGSNTATCHHDTYDPAFTVKGDFSLVSPSVWTKSATVGITLSPDGTKTWSDTNATKQELSAVSITGGTNTPKINLGSGVKATTVTIAASHELSANGTNTLSLTGTGTPFTNNGVFTPSTGTVAYSGSGSISVEDGNYHTISFDSGGTFTLQAGTFTIANDFIISDTWGATIAANTNNPTITITRDFDINGANTFTSTSGNLTVGRHFKNLGSTFTHNSGTVILNTTTTTEIHNTGGSEMIFHNFTATTSTKVIQFYTTGSAQYRFNGLLTFADVTVTRLGGSGSWTINHQGTESVTNTTISWSACSTSPLTSTEITALTSSGNVDGGNNGACWIFSAGGITISGNAYDDESTGDLTICNGSTQNISLKVAAQSVVSVACADSGGAFSFSGVTAPADGGTIAVFINVDGTTVGNTVTRYDGSGDVTGLHVRKNRLVITSDNASVITNTILDNYDNDNNSEDMIYTVASGNLTLEDGIKLIVKETATTTFQPGGTITTSVSNDGADSIVNGDVSVEASAVLNMESNNLSIGGDLSNSGTLTYSAGQTTTFTATASGHTIADNTSNFHHLTFNGTNGDWSMTSAVVLGGALTVTAGTLSGTQDMTVTTDATGAGTINLTGGTFEQRVGASEDFGTTSGSNNWTFNNLTFSRSAGTPTITTQTGGSGTIAITGTLKISKTGDGAATTLDAGNRTWILSNSNLAKPFTLDEASGVLTPNSSTFNFTGDNDGGDVTLENTTYNHLQIGGATAENYTPEGAIILNGDFTTNSSGTLNGAQNITVNGGDVSGAGGINLSGGLFTLSGTPGANFGSAANWVFDSLTIGGATNTTYTATGAGSITVNETLTIDGSDTLNGGTSKTFILTDADGCPCTPLVATGAFTANGSTFKFTGNGATTIPLLTYNHLESSPAGAVTHTLAGGGTLTVGGNLTVGTGSNASILNASTSDPSLDINGSVTINASATLTASDLNDMTVAGGWVNSGAFTHNSRTVTLDGSGAGNTLNAGGTGQPFNILIISGSGSWVVTSTALQTNGDLTVNTGTLSGAQNVTVNGGDLTGTGLINMSGGTFTLNGTPAADFGSATNWIFDSLTIGGATNTTYTPTGAGTFTVNETLTIDGSDTLNGGASKVWILTDADGCPCTPLVATGSFTPNGSTVRYSGVGATNIAGTANSGTITYNVLESVPAGTVTHTLGTAASQTIVVNDNFTVGDGVNSSTIQFNTNDPAVTVKGNVWLKAEAIWAASGTVGITLSPAGTKTLTDSNTTKQDLGIISITGGTTTPKIQVASSFKATTVAIAASHELDIQTNTLTLTGNGTTVLDKNATGTVTFGTGSTVDFISAGTGGTTVPSLNYYNLTVNTASNTFTMSAGSPTLGGNLTITAGTLDLDTSDPTLTVNGNIVFAGTLTPSGSSSLTVKGNWTNNGTFTDVAGSTVVINPTGTTSTIAGSNATTFRNLTASNQGGKTLQFKANTTTVISGVLTLSGVSGDVLWVKSDSANNQWTLSITGSAPSIDYVIFQDTACHGGTTSVLLGQHVFDAGNNGLCFNFIKRGSSVGASDGSTGGGSGQTGGGQGGGGGGGGGGGEGQGGGGGGGGGGGSP